jgi:hypothetical protein
MIEFSNDVLVSTKRGVRWVPRLADTSRVLHWDYNDIGVSEVP